MNASQILARAAMASLPRQQPQQPQEQGEPLMSAEETAKNLSDLQGRSEGTLGKIQRVIDTPGAIFRGIAVGKPFSGFGWSNDDRVSGIEFAEHYGLIGENTPSWLRTGVGLGAEIIADPSHMISGPVKALSAAGEIGQLAGLMRHAPVAAAKVLGPKAATTLTGKGTTKFLSKMLPNRAAVNAGNLSVRPLVGQRVAQNILDIDQLIAGAPDAAKALRDVQNALRAKRMTMDSIRGMKLGGSMRLKLGSGNVIPPLLWSPRGKTAMSVLDAMDATGNALSWSLPARVGSAVFDKRVGGRVDALKQLGSMRRDTALDTSTGAVREAFSQHVLKVNRLPMSDAAQKIVGGKDLNTPLGGEFLTRLYEGALVQSDTTLINEIGKSNLDTIYKSWDDVRKLERVDAKALGMATRRWRSPFGIEWSPRKATEAQFDDYGKGIGSKVYNAKTLENEARKKYLNTPGGTFDLQQISRLPLVARFAKEGVNSTISKEQVGAEIKRFLDAKHGVDTAAGRAYLQSVGLVRDPRLTPFQLRVKKVDPVTGDPILLPQQGPLMLGKVGKNGAPGKLKKLRDLPTYTGEAIDTKQAERIAGFMGRKDPALPVDATIFGAHPSVMQAGAGVSAATARTNARHVYDSLAEAAEFAGTGKSANSIAGNLRRPLDRALGEAAKAVGLETRIAAKAAAPMSHHLMQEAIGLRIGEPASSINLAEWSVSEEVLSRLTAVKDVFETPRLLKSLGQLMTNVNGIYKGFLLAFPATKTRDMYSNTYQIWALNGSIQDTFNGLHVAMKIVAGNTTEAAAMLRKQIPAYRNVLSPLDEMTKDVSRTGILQTLASSDLVTSNRTANLNQLVPGMVPQRLGDFVKEITPDFSRNPLQMAGDYFTFKDVRYPWQKHAANETKNAMFNASQKVNDFTDSVGRLGGMLSLMAQGMSAEEAARKVTAALVDYGSLTTIEKSVFKTIFPWWAYMSRSGAWAAKELITNPGGRYGQTLRAFNRIQESDKNTYVPEALRQQFAVKVPDSVKEWAGLGKSDTTTFLKDLDVAGHDVASLPVLGPTLYDAIHGTTANIAGQTNPLIRSAVELATGKDLFSKRPLREADSSLDKVYRGLSGSKSNMNPIARQAINLIPSPRWSGIAATALDPRIPNAQTRATKILINTLFGVKLQDVDLQYQLGDARRMYENLLGDEMRNQIIPFVPADRRLLLSPQKQKDLANFDYYDKRLRKERERVQGLAK